MDITQLSFLCGWAALLSAIATVATLITAALFFAVGERFGKINDAVSVIQMLLMLPVALALFLLRPADATGLALLAAVVGSIGMIAAGVLQALLVFGLVEYQQTIAAVLSAGGMIGVWLILTNALALSSEILPMGLVAFGLAAGAGYILAAIGFYKGGQRHPLFYVGSVLLIVGYSVWAAWFGRLLQMGRFPL